MPRDSYANGHSELLSTLTASEYYGLLWQLRVVVGEHEDYNTECMLPMDVRVKVTKALTALLELRNALWKPVHSQSELDGLPELIKL